MGCVISFMAIDGIINQSLHSYICPNSLMLDYFGIYLLWEPFDFDIIFLHFANTTVPSPIL
jgi:hypothetical protein